MLPKILFVNLLFFFKLTYDSTSDGTQIYIVTPIFWVADPFSNHQRDPDTCKPYKLDVELDAHLTVQPTLSWHLFFFLFFLSDVGITKSLKPWNLAFRSDALFFLSSYIPSLVTLHSFPIVHSRPSFLLVHGPFTIPVSHLPFQLTQIYTSY